MTDGDDEKWRERGREFGRIEAQVADLERRMAETEGRLERLLWRITLGAVSALMAGVSYAVRLLAGEG